MPTLTTHANDTMRSLAIGQHESQFLVADGVQVDPMYGLRIFAGLVISWSVSKELLGVNRHHGICWPAVVGKVAFHTHMEGCFTEGVFVNEHNLISFSWVGAECRPPVYIV